MSFCILLLIRANRKSAEVQHSSIRVVAPACQQQQMRFFTLKYPEALHRCCQIYVPPDSFQWVRETVLRCWFLLHLVHLIAFTDVKQYFSQRRIWHIYEWVTQQMKPHIEATILQKLLYMTVQWGLSQLRSVYGPRTAATPSLPFNCALSVPTSTVTEAHFTLSKKAKYLLKFNKLQW